MRGWESSNFKLTPPSGQVPGLWAADVRETPDQVGRLLQGVLALGPTGDKAIPDRQMQGH